MNSVKTTDLQTDEPEILYFVEPRLASLAVLCFLKRSSRVGVVRVSAW